MSQQPSQQSGFFGLGLAPKLLESVEALGFTTPTPIQLQSIPPAIEGKDIVGIAQTGTGKTLAFGLPLLQRLAQTKGRGLVLVPTRELALQANEELNKIGRAIGLRTAVLIGGQSIHLQLRSLKRNPHIILATPGRLIDHLQQHTVRLNEVRMLVLDEADRMLDMGFAPQINQILKLVPSERQTMLFSAIMPQEIMRLAKTHMQLPVQLEIAPSGTTAETVRQELYVVRNEHKLSLLEDILLRTNGPVLVFSRTKYGASKITRAIRAMGYAAAELHSDRSLSQRRQALDGFKRGAYRILIATDIAARGIDVKEIELVVNYDLPDDPEDYVHRIGRTGRAGVIGRAISFAMPDQGNQVRDIERLIRAHLPATAHAYSNKAATKDTPAHLPIRRASSARGRRTPAHRHHDRASQQDSPRTPTTSSGGGYWMKPRNRRMPRGPRR